MSYKPKTHCRNGHEKTPENTRVYLRPDGSTDRRCKECDRQNNRLYRMKMKQAIHGVPVWPLNWPAPERS